MTQIDEARQGVITEEMKICAGQEGRDPEFIRAGVADGTIVVIRVRRPVRHQGRQDEKFMTGKRYKG